MEDQKTLRGGCFSPSIYVYAKTYNYSVSGVCGNAKRRVFSYIERRHPRIDMADQQRIAIELI